jgi:NAD(P)-dependent dehydrogenase (short-subunit alcohol dehydrogenase family)
MSDGRRWALVLGSSSGFGEAAAKALAASGRSILGVHMDRRSTMPHVEEVVAALESAGAEVAFFNMNAADPDKRAEALDAMKERMGPDDGIDVLLHSLAFGTLRPYTGDQAVSEALMDMTVRVMAHSLVDWVQGVISRGMMGEGGRIFAMTSSGSTRVIPSYGPVSAAKAALESHIRQLAYELAPLGITANALRGGVTDTPALRKIPGNDRLIDAAKARNPAGRLTTPEDVAAALVALAVPETRWVTGNVINVDGGEEITG